jgi:hypothetical protein
MAIRTLLFLAIVLMGVSLVPSGAHLFALPNKIGMSQEDYFTAQQIYAGWQLIGISWVAALIVNLVLTVRLRGQGAAFVFAIVALLSIAIAFAVFFTWTFPANQATVNWTIVPANWQALRLQWEYSHAANAIILFIGFCGAVLAAMADSRRR